MKFAERDLLYILHDLARALRTRMDHEARLANGMTRAQWAILSRLEHQPGISQSKLAAIFEVKPISVARLVDRLEQRGLVSRQINPTDRRVRGLHLEPAASQILEAINKTRASMSASITAGLDEDKLSDLIGALLVLKANMAKERLDRDRRRSS